MDRVPLRLKPPLLWVLRFPHMLLRNLERIRLRSSGRVAAVIDQMQRMLMSKKQRANMIAEDGERRPYLPIDMACKESFVFQNSDVLLAAGYGWLHSNIARIGELKREVRLQFAFFCQDIIPLLFPQHYRPHDVDVFRSYFEAALPLCDQIIFSTGIGEQHVREYCSQHGLQIGRTAIAPLGSDLVVKRDSLRPLPASLSANKYILFVSTIEPRKNHRLLYDTWVRLVADGVPQATGFKLVFVGRQGWMMDEFCQTLSADSRVADSLLVWPTVDDATLATLYDQAAFCVYPSIYEGYGLPVVEAFARGKAVISSSGGGLAEVGGTFSPCLDPTDLEAWFRTMRDWMENPIARGPYERAIRESFSHPTWAESSEKLLSLVQSLPKAAGDRI
jgi:glycosyltransferase involved in cell wall biosynthesis